MVWQRRHFRASDGERGEGTRESLYQQFSLPLGHKRNTHSDRVPRRSHQLQISFDTSASRHQYLGSECFRGFFFYLSLFFEGVGGGVERIPRVSLDKNPTPGLRIHLQPSKWDGIFLFHVEEQGGWFNHVSPPCRESHSTHTSLVIEKNHLLIITGRFCVSFHTLMIE